MPTPSPPPPAPRLTSIPIPVPLPPCSAATSVSLKDLSFPASRFLVHEGTFRPTFASLAGGASISSRVVLTPRRAGELLVSPAAVTYTDAAGQSHVTRLASADNIVVENLLAYRRRTDRHAAEWGAYAAAFLLFVVAPAAYAALLERGVVVGEGAKKR